MAKITTTIPTTLFDDLQEQHAADLAVYRSAHTHAWNVRLHYALVPLEVASFLWLLAASCEWLASHLERRLLLRHTDKTQKTRQAATARRLLRLAVPALGWTLGSVSCAVARHPWRTGLPILLFHAGVVHVSPRIIRTRGVLPSLTWGGVVWTAAWGLQIVVGHHLMEGKPPNLLNPHDDVSLLSAVTSIALAWEC